MSSESGSRRLETVLFTDVVASTEIAIELGDAKWKDLVSRYHAIVRKALKRFGGRQVDTAGDGVFSVFTTPARAIRCAAAIVGDVQELGIDIRAGLHVGEVELVGREVRGIAVHIGSRVCGAAGPAEIFVTSSLMELVAGSGIGFADVGMHELRGLAESRHLYKVETLDGTPMLAPLETGVAAQLRASLEVSSRRTKRRWLVPIAVTALVLIVAALIMHPSASPRAKPTGVPPLGSVVEVDPTNGHPLRVFDRDFAVNENTDPRLKVGEGGLWLLTDSRLYRVDEVSGAVRPSETAVDVVVAPHEVFVATGALYAPNPSVEEIDPATGAVVRQRAVHDYLEGIGLGENLVWLAGGIGVHRIDPSTLRTTGSIPIEGGASDVVASGTDVWVTSSYSGTLTKIDAGTMKIKGHPTDLSTSPDRIVVGFGQLWLLDRSAGLVVVADQATGKLLGTVPVGSEASDIAIGADSVWVSTPTGLLVRIDPLVRQPVSQIDLRVPIAALDVDPVTGHLWAFVAEQPHGG